MSKPAIFYFSNNELSSAGLQPFTYEENYTKFVYKNDYDDLLDQYATLGIRCNEYALICAKDKQNIKKLKAALILWLIMGIVLGHMLTFAALLTPLGQ